jgi:hypothetical protein
LRWWAIVVCIVLAACGRIGFDSDQAKPCDLTAPGVSSLVDDFADGSFEPNWFNGGTCMIESGGALVAAPPANTDGVYCLAYTHALYRIGCDSFFVHVAEATTPIHGSQTVVYLVNDDHQIYLLLDSGGFQLSADQDIDTTVYLPEPYDPVADAWWRFRGEPGTLYFDTSPDGATWAPRGEIAVSFALEALQVTLGAGTYIPLPDPGTARFRCFNEPPPCF